MTKMTRLSLSLFAALSLMTGATLPAFAQETVVVPTRVIYPGETVSADLLEQVPLRRKLRNPASIAFNAAQLDGKVARRTLLPGRLVAVNSVREAWLVERGATVRVRLVHGPLEITLAGVPLEPGSAGDLVRVRNIDSGAIFTGVVMDDGSIRVSAS